MTLSSEEVEYWIRALRDRTSNLSNLVEAQIPGDYIGIDIIKPDRTTRSSGFITDPHLHTEHNLSTGWYAWDMFVVMVTLDDNGGPINFDFEIIGIQGDGWYMYQYVNAQTGDTNIRGVYPITADKTITIDGEDNWVLVSFRGLFECTTAPGQFSWRWGAPAGDAISIWEGSWLRVMPLFPVV